MDPGVLRRYAQVRTSALTVSLVAAVGVILLGVLQGIIVAIVLAILSFFRRNWRPNGTVLGEVPEMGGWYGHRAVPRGHPAPRVCRVPLGIAALLCQQWSVPG